MLSGRIEGCVANRAVVAYEAAGDLRARAQAHNMLGMLARNAGEPESALAQLERSLELARKLGDDPAQAAALNNLALVRRDAGDLSRRLS
jgi:tetratricopeptide (TPR) repeat protein